MTTYEISVLDGSSAAVLPDILAGFGDVTYAVHPAETVLFTEPVDQDCMLRLVTRIADLGLDLIEVRLLTRRAGVGRAA